MEVLLAYWAYGFPGSRPPKAATVLVSALHLTRFVVWLESKNVKRFRDVSAIHFHEYARSLKETLSTRGKKAGGSLGDDTIGNYLASTQLPWKLRDRLTDPIRDVPFASRGRMKLSVRGHVSHSKDLKTYCMTWDQVSCLYGACEHFLVKADSVLLALEEGRELYKQMENDGVRIRVARNRYSKWLRERHSTTPSELRWHAAMIRASAVTELLMLVGIRASELLSLERGCVSSDEDETLWIASRSYKSTPSEMESKIVKWIAPKRAEALIEWLIRFSDLHVPILDANIEDLRTEMAYGEPEEAKADTALALNKALAARGSIFLSKSNAKGTVGSDCVAVVDRNTVGSWIKSIAKYAGIRISVSQQVLRRTFAFMVVNQCNGDLRYLRTHFRHWSVDMTAAYASHPERDIELADDIGAELLQYKTDMVSSWLDQDEVLAGAGGQHIERQRSKPEFQAHTLKDKRELAAVLQRGLSIRPTGHGWCTAAGVIPCGGRGLYDPKQCASGCGGAVVTRKHLPTWVRLTEQLLEAKSLGDCGPAGEQAIESSLKSFDEVLRPFGASVALIEHEMRSRKHAT